MNFLFDMNCSPKLIRLAQEATPQYQCVRLCDEFKASTPDEVWIPAVGQRNERWIVVSGDNLRITKKAQAAVLRDSDLSWIMLMTVFTNALLEQRRDDIVAVWQRATRLLQKERERSVYKIAQDPYRRKGEANHRFVFERYKALQDL